MPFVSRTRATFRSAEFGFFGVVVYTRVQTPRFCGAPRSAGVFVLLLGARRPFLTSWFTVGMKLPVRVSTQQRRPRATAPCQPPGHGSKDQTAVKRAELAKKRPSGGGWSAVRRLTTVRR